MSAKLTEAQRRLLQAAYSLTFSDRSGQGKFIEDGIELAVYERLATKGLVTIGANSLYARTTDAGRAALASPAPKGEGQ